MAGEDRPQSSPGCLARLAERWSAGGGARLVSGAVVLAVALGGAWLFDPGASLERMPGDDLLGTRAKSDIVAVRDHEIFDAEATRERRDLAEASEPPVFDWDERAAAEASARVTDAFAALRGSLAQVRGKQERLAFLTGQREVFETRLGVRVGEGDFATLVDSQFSKPLQDELIRLAGRGLFGMVVQDRWHVAAAFKRGIAVRSIRGGVPQEERVVPYPGEVRELALARDDVEREIARLPSSVRAAQRSALSDLSQALLRPTLVFDLAETALRERNAAERVKPVFLHVKRGEKIVGSGELIEKRHLVVFRGIRDQTRGPSAIWVRIGATFLVGLIVLVLWRHARRNVPGFRPTVKDALLLAFALLGSAALAFAGLFCGESLHDRYPRVGAEVLFYLMPFAAGAAIVRSALSAEVALLFSVASGCLVGLVAGDSFFIALYALLTSAVAAGLAARTCGRSSLFRVGAVVGAVGAALVLSTLALEGRKPAAALLPALAAAAAGFVLLPALVVCSVPVLARVFGYLTHFELQKLANLNHPALKDLIIQAPGTYHHSVVVGSLVEAAATSIGANPLLARVCAYYHDLGKTLNPLYFAENERGDGCHEELAPSMSALIVKRHVLDGLELAERWKLPQAVREAIEQHHGTRLVACFFAKARAREGGLRCDESVFRYPGPKPRAREAALVMIADACEASARVLSQVPEGLGELVRRRIEEVFAEGQLDECELTLKDLNAVAAAMAHALEQVYGGRSGQEGGDPSAPRAGAAQPTRQLRIVDAEGDLP